MVISAKAAIRLIGTNLSQKAREEAKNLRSAILYETLQTEMEAGSSVLCPFSL